MKDDLVHSDAVDLMIRRLTNALNASDHSPPTTPADRCIDPAVTQADTNSDLLIDITMQPSNSSKGALEMNVTLADLDQPFPLFLSPQHYHLIRYLFATGNSIHQTRLLHGDLNHLDVIEILKWYPPPCIPNLHLQLNDFNGDLTFQSEILEPKPKSVHCGESSHLKMDWEKQVLCEQADAVQQEFMNNRKYDDATIEDMKQYLLANGKKNNRRGTTRIKKRGLNRA
jgi:hypothetical protein